MPLGAGATMATLHDIAEHFGLAESTVSRVLNKKGRVSAETRRRVLAYAAEVNYHPNLLARGLKEQRSNTVGVLVPDITNEYYALMFKAIDDGMRSSGFTSIVFNTNEDMAREQEFLGYLHSSQIDGMIAATSGSSAYDHLQDAMLDRVVFIDNIPAVTRPVRYVGSDNIASSRELTEHLIARGHRRIATLVGSLAESSARERLEGFQACLRQHQLPLPAPWIVKTNFLYDDGYRKAGELLTAVGRPTAIIAQNNVLAYAVIRVANEVGLHVPGDLAVACFDHIDVYGFMRPVITTMLQPLDEIAAIACRELLDRIDGGPVNPGRTMLPVHFRLGETT
jgi:LacI family transcriptional regulator